MLEFDVSGPTVPPHRATVLVLLHGRGSHRGDLQALRSHLPEDWTLVTPQAPHPGHPWGYGPGWAWYRYLGEDRVEDDTLRESLTELDELLAHLPALLHAEPRHLVLGGFSQGGTSSMAYALTRPGAVTAVLNFSGFLPDSAVMEAAELSPAASPIFWGHGTRDPNIPWDLARKGRASLTSGGVPLVDRDYDIGHWIVPEEVGDAVRFLDDLESGTGDSQGP